MESGAEGFIPSKRVFAYLQTLGFTPEQIDSAISRCFNKRLLETGARRVPTVAGNLEYVRLRLTSVGLYHISELAATFTYIDAVVVDTPILEKEMRGLIKRDPSTERPPRTRDGSCASSTWIGVGDLWKAQICLSDWPERSGEVKRLMNAIAPTSLRLTSSSAVHRTPANGIPLRINHIRLPPPPSPTAPTPTIQSAVKPGRANRRSKVIRAGVARGFVPGFRRLAAPETL